LRHSQEQFFKAFQNNPSAIAILSRDDYRYIDVNESFVLLTGYSREELLGKSPIDFSIFLDELEFYQISAKDTDNEKGILRESKLRHSSGKIIEVLHSIEQFDIGQHQYLIHTFIDITSRNQRERELGGIAAMATALRTAQTYTEVLPIVLVMLHKLPTLKVLL
jgi:PAS domain S-box-containing protein